MFSDAEIGELGQEPAKAEASENKRFGLKSKAPKGVIDLKFFLAKSLD